MSRKRKTEPAPLPERSVVQKSGTTPKGGKFKLTVVMSAVTINGQEISSDLAAEATAAFIESALKGTLENQ